MISRLQTNGTSTSQSLWRRVKTAKSLSCGTCQSILIETITANRPDIIIKDSVNSTCKLIDMSIPSDRNIALKEMDKKSKYKDLELEIQRMWQMKSEVIPVVVGALGTIKKGMVENIKRVSARATATETQKISMLGSARILRKVLNVWSEWMTCASDAPGAWFAPGWWTKRHQQRLW